MAKAFALVYGLVAYLIFLATFLYAVAFVGNFLVPKTIDSGTPGPFFAAFAINAVLLSLFAVQHSVMARPAFKRAWTKIVPRHLERSTYVLCANACLILLYWQWQPMPQAVWNVENPIGRLILWALFVIGWLLVLTGTLMINHAELFGLRQVFFFLRGKEYEDVGFQQPMLYKVCRHPIMLGFIVAFWATPGMSLGHLIFAIATTAYIVLAIQFEEHDLITAHGEQYVNYRGRTSMLLPLMRRSK